MPPSYSVCYPLGRKNNLLSKHPHIITCKLYNSFIPPIPYAHYRYRYFPVLWQNTVNYRQHGITANLELGWVLFLIFIYTHLIWFGEFKDVRSGWVKMNISFYSPRSSVVNYIECVRSSFPQFNSPVINLLSANTEILTLLI